MDLARGISVFAGTFVDSMFICRCSDCLKQDAQRDHTYIVLFGGESAVYGKAYHASECVTPNTPLIDDCSWVGGVPRVQKA